MELSKKICGEI